MSTLAVYHRDYSESIVVQLCSEVSVRVFPPLLHSLLGTLGTDYYVRARGICLTQYI